MKKVHITKRADSVSVQTVQGWLYKTTERGNEATSSGLGKLQKVLNRECELPVFSAPSEEEEDLPRHGKEKCEKGQHRDEFKKPATSAGTPLREGERGTNWVTALVVYPQTTVKMGDKGNSTTLASCLVSFKKLERRGRASVKTTRQWWRARRCKMKQAE